MKPFGGTTEGGPAPPPQQGQDPQPRAGHGKSGEGARSALEQLVQQEKARTDERDDRERARKED